MLENEATWIAATLAELPDEGLSPLVNIGSGTRAFREQTQAFIHDRIFAPLEKRHVAVLHQDLKQQEGVDVAGDLYDPALAEQVRAAKPKAVLCSNVLEHVTDPAGFCRILTGLMPQGGWLLLTVPHSYPYHADPIDTLFRPTPEDLAALLPGCRLVRGEIIDCGSYRDQVARRPWLLLRHLFRLPFPFLSYRKWRRSMVKLRWLVRPYQASCVLFEVPREQGGA